MRCPTLAELPAAPRGKIGWPWDIDAAPHSSPGTRITVVTPSFNQASFLEETMRSVLLQGYTDLEYIVIDGGSTDGSVDIIRKYEKYLAHWSSQADDGAADAIRKGFEKGTGSVFAYLNSDDLYLPGALYRIERAFREREADVVYGNLLWMDRDGKALGQRRQTPFARMGYLYGGFDLQQPATFWKRDLYLKCGGIDPTYRFAFDTDLFFRFANNAARFRHVNKCVASFRIHPQSKSSNESLICEQELQRLRAANQLFPFGSFRARCFRNLARIKRAFWYTVQGDLIWLLGRIPDRIRARNAQAIVGPRGRRL